MRATEVRANDFIGPGAVSPFTLMVGQQVLDGQPASVPADLDPPHSWSYTGDVARTLIAASRSEQAWGRTWHLPSAAVLSVRDLATRLAEARGRAGPPAEPHAR